MSSNKLQKVLFVHDGPLYEDASGRFYGLHYNNKLVGRYTLLGGRVCFMSRVSNMPDTDKNRFSEIDHPAFSMIKFPDLKTLSNRLKNKEEAKKIASKAVLDSDVIIARLPSSSGSLAVKYALKYKKPLMVEFVACGWDAYWNYNWKGKIVAPYFFLRQRIRMMRVPHTIYVTKEFLQRRYPAGGKTVGISDVELPRLSFDVVEKRLLKINNRDKDAPLVLGTVAALDVPYKGQADVIRAVFILKKKGFNVRYLLVGQGNPARLKNLIYLLGLQEEVTIIGSVPHDQVFPFLDDIDLYIQPSKQEGLPRAMIEAMSRGCMVLGSAVGGIPELIDRKYIFKSGDANAIALAIEKLNKGVLLECAHVNYSTAGTYSGETLEARRKAFYAEFMEDYQLNDSQPSF